MSLFGFDRLTICAHALMSNEIRGRFRRQPRGYCTPLSQLDSSPGKPSLGNQPVSNKKKENEHSLEYTLDYFTVVFCLVRLATLDCIAVTL